MRWLFGHKPIPPFSKLVTKSLLNAGWSPDHDQSSLADSCSRLLGSRWNDAASAFVRKFGGLNFLGHLWIWATPYWEEKWTDTALKMESVTGTTAAPVASSSYIGDGCVIWIDAKGRFYAADSEGMIFLAEDTPTAFEVLLCHAKPALPPEELRGPLASAYEWNKPPG